MVRSPSFSRSSSSTTTTNLPWRMSSMASSMVAKGLCVRGSAAVVTAPSYPCLFGQRLPDDLRGVEHEFHDAFVECAHLARERAHRVVEESVALVVAQVQSPAHDLAAADRVCPAVAAPVEPDERAVFRLDHTLEVRQKGPVLPPARMVRATQSPGHATLAAALGQEEMLTL